MIQDQYIQTITIEQLQYNFWSTFLIRHKHFIVTTSRKSIISINRTASNLKALDTSHWKH